MQQTSARSSIAETFSDLKIRRQIALVPFIPAGYPNLGTTIACLHALEQSGASLIEVGIPFSDPIADGPVIQEAFTEALANKIKVAEVFKAIATARPALRIPVVAMLSYSIVFRCGIEKFAADAKATGFDGLIIPDLPPPEAQSVTERIRAAGLDTILLVAPTTTAERRKQIAQLSSGFVYYLSVSGITGERDQLPTDLAQSVRELKKLTDRPVCVGFGIHQPQQVRQLQSLADGAIVGTAYVRRMKQNLEQPPARIAQIVADYTRELLSQVR
jgi:tryptophan synthase alpha chain